MVGSGIVKFFHCAVLREIARRGAGFAASSDGRGQAVTAHDPDLVAPPVTNPPDARLAGTSSALRDLQFHYEICVDVIARLDEDRAADASSSRPTTA
jgi:hypothetical protein